MIDTLIWCAVAAAALLLAGSVAAHVVSLVDGREVLPVSSDEADDLAARQWLADRAHARARWL